ncbi:f-box protein gid2-like [Arabis alpina]|uniref:F-box protein GID2 n=1 Tax=Arabis alpina TaxID=50452 RepID=A0A087GMU5_ARAAL|nr:f-box protein gid2-like [Arabis alpina]
MKRSLSENESTNENKKMKKSIAEEEETIGFGNLDENLVYEVLKHVDARTLGMSSCVSKIWHKTAQDERLWELICTRHWANIGCSHLQLRSVVLALGGFRQLHSTYLWPLSNPNPNRPFGKDELKLSLSLLSIQYYTKMSFTTKRV